MMRRRYFLKTGLVKTGLVTLGAATLSPLLFRNSSAQAAPRQLSETFEVMKTEAQWRQILTPAQFNILRRQGTERPFSSPLAKTVAKGTYHCAGCDLPLFSSTTKFDSGTGWPSFYAPLTRAVATSSDRSLFMTRVEVHCRRCGGHLGHVFDDGPAPTGKRYCMNGLALKFVASV